MLACVDGLPSRLPMRVPYDGDVMSRRESPCGLEIIPQASIPRRQGAC